MNIQELKNAWHKLAGRLRSDSLYEPTTEEDKAVYQYLLKTVIPDELAMLDESDEIEET